MWWQEEVTKETKVKQESQIERPVSEICGLVQTSQTVKHSSFHQKLSYESELLAAALI